MLELEQVLEQLLELVQVLVPLQVQGCCKRSEQPARR